MTHSSCRLITGGLGLIIPLSLLMAGCGPSQQEIMAKDRLERARTAYSQAKSNPNVETYAPVPLLDAGKALEAAEKTGDYSEMEYHAYLAEKKALTASAIAEGKTAETELQTLKKQSTDILLQKREREARLAKGEAQAKTRELEMVKKEAEAKTTEAEKAKMLAESKASEAEKARAEAEKARADAEQLMKELSELKAKQTDRGIVLTLGDVLFETGKADLSTQAKRSIDKLAEFLNTHTTRNVLIEGHTDSVGSVEYNIGLSERRAEAVKTMLAERGISADRIATKGYGKKYPVASNGTAYGRQQNRRVEVIILNEGVKPETMFR